MAGIIGKVAAIPEVGCLHHRYERLAAWLVSIPVHQCCGATGTHRLRSRYQRFLDLDNGAEHLCFRSQPNSLLRTNSLATPLLLKLRFRCNFGRDRFQERVDYVSAIYPASPKIARMLVPRRLRKTPGGSFWRPRLRDSLRETDYLVCGTNEGTTCR